MYLLFLCSRYFINMSKLYIKNSFSVHISLKRIMPPD